MKARRRNRLLAIGEDIPDEKDESSKMQEQRQTELVRAEGESRIERMESGGLISIYRDSSIRPEAWTGSIEGHDGGKESEQDDSMEFKSDDTYKAKIRLSEMRTKLERAQERDVARRLTAQRDSIHTQQPADSGQQASTNRALSHDDCPQPAGHMAHRCSPHTPNRALVGDMRAQGDLDRDPTPSDVATITLQPASSRYASSTPANANAPGPDPCLVLSAIHSEIFGSDPNIKSRMAGNSFNFVPRSASSPIDLCLVKKFRIIFLRVVRLNYMKQVQSGRLPRGSYAAQVLFNSIDVGMATVHTDGLQDWDAVNVSRNPVFRCSFVSRSMLSCLSLIMSISRI